ncbi:MAG: stage 0 sporulation family protein [Peptoniphilaceae bacterium]|nr:stage 0 sporulation family protein [Peptoniphilaceae bacterium]MDD7383313.1 stage 0 sporulation family protein [Peptoniphilaceae bacterium]MDY3738316.1 stage 0 sporulation family protein [Peptoniphilaceae bacterium]
MRKIIGVSFDKACKIYYFDPLDIKFSYNDYVIVNTVRGVELGKVKIAEGEVGDDFNPELRPVIRKANEEDIITKELNRKKAIEAKEICAQKIKEHNLDMKLVDCEFTFDRKKVIFYFTSDIRVDFRELVKDLVSVFRNRIELRQIGVRDQAKTLGAIGCCGREICCHNYLREFSHVSIQMAKDQNITLNPTKISGSCGRLMCCLNFEQSTYEDAMKILPKVSEKVKTKKGYGYVVSNNYIKLTSRIRIPSEDQDIEEDFSSDEIIKVTQEEYERNVII